MMTQKKLPPIEQLRKLLSYDPDTGIFIWKPRGPSDFSGSEGHGAAWKAANWNAQHAGRTAFYVREDGYMIAHINRAMYRAHRIAWAMHYGVEPKGKIDHINGNRADNRIANLRIVTNEDNARNSAKSRNNSSGITGVFFQKKDSKPWHAYIGHGGKKKHLGCFRTKTDAAQARKDAEKALGYHVNHGR